MKLTFKYLLFSLLVISFARCQPDQNKKSGKDENFTKPTQEKTFQPKEQNSDRMEKFKAEKIAYMTEKLDLSPAEAQKFWPVYNEFEQERFASQGKRHELDKKIREFEDSISDKEILELNHQLVQSFQDEADVVKKYNEKLMKILSPKKVLMVYKAENQFRMEMIRKFREKQQPTQPGEPKQP